MEMKKITEEIRKMVNYLTILLQALIKILQIRYKKSKQEYNKKEKLSRQQELNARVYNIMRECAKNLFEALGSHSYPKLQKIVNPQSFRNYDYQIIKGVVMYRYTLPKQSPERLPVVVLNNIQENMNRDIASMSHDIASCMGYDYLNEAYPLLANGIYVVAISDCGEDILITIFSYYQPYRDLLF
jgi:hypothetical protein